MHAAEAVDDVVDSVEADVVDAVAVDDLVEADVADVDWESAASELVGPVVLQVVLLLVTDDVETEMYLFVVVLVAAAQ